MAKKATYTQAEVDAIITEKLTQQTEIIPSDPKHIGLWRLGAIYFIRTVTMTNVGRLIAISEHELLLEDAAWIPDTGRFADALKTETFNECEPFPDGHVIVNRGCIVDAKIVSKLQRVQK
jgi:hypothetical protein